MKVTTLDRIVGNGVYLRRYRLPGDSVGCDRLGRIWQMLIDGNDGTPVFIGLLWEHDLEEDRTWLRKRAKIA